MITKEQLFKDIDIDKIILEAKIEAFELELLRLRDELEKHNQG